MNRDKPTCNCGVFGIWGAPDSAITTYYGLHSLQHRGQEAAGIITQDENSRKFQKFNFHKGFGLVSEVFSGEDVFTKQLSGNSAIGHNRYSTTGSSDSHKNIQPFWVNYHSGKIAIAHNGNLTNAKILRKQLIKDGAIFQTSSDTEVVLHLIARSKAEKQIDQIIEALNQVEGAYSFVFLTEDKLIAARDPNGYRPLVIGKLNGSFIAASETCALDINKAKYIRDVEPGELVIIDNEANWNNEVKSIIFTNQEINTKHCIFEFIYFSRPDSKIFGTNVDKIRRKLGKVLAEKHPVYQDGEDDKVVVISVPDSSNTAAIGYQSQLVKMDIPSKLEIGLIRSHYIGRTFISPSQSKREMGVRIKFNTVKGVLEGKTIVLIDDSIVRGTTSKQLVSLIRECNPKSVHMRVSSSPILFPCYYGMDFPSKEELIANKCDGDINKMAEEIGVDTLEYMSIDEMLEAMVDHAPEEFCTACFSGNYPTKIYENFKKEEYDL